MAEIIDDTKSFTISLKGSGPPPETVTLLWVRDNYDRDKSRRINSSEMYRAADDWASSKINDAQMAAVEHAYGNNTLLPAYTVSTTPARGQLVGVNYPSVGVHGATITISCKVQNTGQTAGSFLVELSGGNKVVRTSRFTVNGESTSPTKTQSTRLPTSGPSVRYTLKCIRIT